LRGFHRSLGVSRFGEHDDSHPILPANAQGSA
jgi:hypothetical protein